MVLAMAQWHPGHKEVARTLLSAAIIMCQCPESVASRSIKLIGQFNESEPISQFMHRFSSCPSVGLFC